MKIRQGNDVYVDFHVLDGDDNPIILPSYVEVEIYRHNGRDCFVPDDIIISEGTVSFKVKASKQKLLGLYRCVISFTQEDGTYSTVDAVLFEIVRYSCEQKKDKRCPEVDIETVTVSGNVIVGGECGGGSTTNVTNQFTINLPDELMLIELIEYKDSAKFIQISGVNQSGEELIIQAPLGMGSNADLTLIEWSDDSEDSIAGFDIIITKEVGASATTIIADPDIRNINIRYAIA